MMSTTNTMVSPFSIPALGCPSGVAQFRRDRKQHAAAHILTNEALVPALDDCGDADREHRGLAAGEGIIEGFAIPYLADVVGDQVVAGCYFCAIALAEHLDFEVFRRAAVGVGNLRFFTEFAGNRGQVTSGSCGISI